MYSRNLTPRLFGQQSRPTDQPTDRQATLVLRLSEIDRPRKVQDAGPRASTSSSHDGWWRNLNRVLRKGAQDLFEASAALPQFSKN